MANKRKLKKAANTLCTQLANQALLLSVILKDDDALKAEILVRKAIEMRQQILDHISFSFDKAPADYENRATYRKERQSYYARGYKALRSTLDKQLEEYVKELNSLLTDELKAVQKNIAAGK